MTTERIRIVIADDQPDTRHGHRLVLNAQPDMLVVGEAADAATAVDLVTRLRPHVVVADIRAPRLGGIGLLRRLTEPAPEHRARVVAVTGLDREEYTLTALRDGAHGVLLKGGSPTLLIEAVRAAMAGDVLISPRLTARLLRLLPAVGRHAELPALTTREIEIVRAVASGSTNADIARQLSITPGTVKCHIANIQGKIGSKNRVGIAAWAWRHGLATADAHCG
jgi:DNA-binding NarL/FixJ family response regulator